MSLTDAADAVGEAISALKRRVKRTPSFKRSADIAQWAVAQELEDEPSAAGIRQRKTTTDSEISETFGQHGVDWLDRVRLFDEPWDDRRKRRRRR